MAYTNKPFDVFISHSAKDATLAIEVANDCRGAGLEPITNGELFSGVDAGDAIWEALAESTALLTILSPSGLTPSMAIEIGATRAWNKPIYAVVTDPASARLPAALAGIRLYTVGRLEDVIRAIKSGVQQWTEEDRTLLIKLHSGMETSVDQLALDSRQLEDLVQRFERGSGKAVPGERLLSELMRLRKQGKLTKHRAKRHARPEVEPA